MGFASLLQAGALVFIAFLTALAALMAIFVFGGLRNRAAKGVRDPEVAFLFEGDVLVDATPAGRRLLGFALTRGNDMARLVAFLTPRFPDLYDRVQACGENDRLLLLSSDCLSRLQIETKGTKLRLSLEEIEPDESDPPERHSLSILSMELAAHRAADNVTSVAVWRTDGDGKVTWANSAYWALADLLDATGSLAPGQFPDLFPDTANKLLKDSIGRRVHLNVKDRSDTRSFEVKSQAIDDDRLYTATPIDGLVAAEQNLRDFIQTLTQTFAHLSVGLAIFDSKRELTLFNPALGDLMGFNVEFLIGRPSLIRFLDQLRERQMMPEPKDYKTWRQKMSELEAAAAEGGHSETWPLPDGRTFRITGRPHPDGAVAFLFEDISAEVSLTREYRKELETGQAVIDTMDEAIAVFSADGRMNFANRAYGHLWHQGSDALRETPTFLEASRKWQTECRPTPVWGDARDFASEISGRSAWHSEVRLASGRRLICRFEPLPGGGTMAGFNQFEPARLDAGGLDAVAPLNSISARA